MNATERESRSSFATTNVAFSLFASSTRSGFVPLPFEVGLVRQGSYLFA